MFSEKIVLRQKEAHKNKKPIECKDENGNTDIYISNYEASKTLNINPSVILYACKHERPVKRGDKTYYFSYLPIEDEEDITSESSHDEDKQQKLSTRDYSKLSPDVQKAIKKVRAYTNQSGFSSKSDETEYANECYKKVKILAQNLQRPTFEYLFSFYNRYKQVDEEAKQNLIKELDI